MQPLEQLARELENLRLQQVRQVAAGQPPTQAQNRTKVTALCTYGSWPDGSDPSSSGHPIRLIAIPEQCTYAQLVVLITRGLAPQTHATKGEAVSSGAAGGRGPSTALPRIRLCHRLPSRPTVVVGVHDDQDVRMMWEESAEHSGGSHLQVFWQWEEEQQPASSSTAGAATAIGPATLAASGTPQPSSTLVAAAPSDGGELTPVPVISALEIVLQVQVPSSRSLFATVYEGEWSGHRVAVKCFSSLLVGRQYGDPGPQRAFLTSAAPVAALRHPHLVKVLGIIANSGEQPASQQQQQQQQQLQQHQAAGLGELVPASVPAPALVMEWVGGGSLHAALGRRDTLLQSGAAMLRVASDVALALAHLHAWGVTHFTLNPSCVLLGGEGGPGARVCGYELPAAKLASLMNPLVAFHPQLLPWLAPELVKEGAPPVTEKVDVYSYGILLWQLWAWRQEPYDCVRLPILADALRGSGLIMRPIIPGKSTPQPVLGWRSLMERCWAEDPAVRPSFQAILTELQALATAAMKGQGSQPQLVQQGQLRAVR